MSTGCNLTYSQYHFRPLFGHRSAHFTRFQTRSSRWFFLSWEGRLCRLHLRRLRRWWRSRGWAGGRDYDRRGLLRPQGFDDDVVYTWRIIPVSKWLVTPIYKPFRSYLGDLLTMVIKHLQVMGWSSKHGWSSNRWPFHGLLLGVTN